MFVIVWFLTVFIGLNIDALTIREKRFTGSPEDNGPLFNNLIKFVSKRDVAELTNKIFENQYSPVLPIDHQPLQSPTTYKDNYRVLSNGQLCKPLKTFIQFKKSGEVSHELCEPIENPYEPKYSPTNTPNLPNEVNIPFKKNYSERNNTNFGYEYPPSINTYLPPVTNTYLPPIQPVAQSPPAGFGAPYVDPVSRASGANPCPDGSKRNLAGDCV